ncbi:MAG: hypothetical protein ACM3UU_08790 [Ignavibacteriales bacterium]
MNNYSYMDDNRNMLACRQLPTSSNLPGYPTVPTSPAFPVPQNSGTGYPKPSIPNPTVINPEYTQGFLKTKIGKRVRIEFLIGSNSIVDRDGTITDVGISFIVLKEPNTGDLVMCDLYAIKFVTFYD